MKPLPVRTKLDFVPRYKAGEFGNASPTWDNYEAFQYDLTVYPVPSSLGPVHIRNRIPQGETWYNVPLEALWTTWEKARAKVGESNLYISSMAPHHRNVLQGEVRQSTEHLELTYSTLPDLPMRDALREGLRRISGLRASLLLRSSLCPNSWEWLNYLLDAYPNHVIEFSAFSVEWGTLPHYNTVFWEVRDY